ncbi:glucose-6-phosphate dehydrogenase [Nakamurella antarctica]|uniref:Glucose-6-phosphate 1-dehydrogenase n=1 Tax=Nakamurella antarctica TaxID=1902245 RepID=A0A3G8ZHY6_9ACTN|nr:glucose-6-phosphate dehydrogenase [Nakamurella antarctica]AZI56979.1 glucose-6-phosphate dehydrogenase [Nakamurella antarctica]
MTTHTPTVFILFGATGDLARRMVLPAFYQLDKYGLMPECWRLVGNGRGEMSDEAFQAAAHDAVAEIETDLHAKKWAAHAKNLRFAGGGFSVDDAGELLNVLQQAKSELGLDTQFVYYLAVPPVAFEKLTSALAAHDLLDGAKVVYEKPYGTDPESFRHLDDLVHSVMDEEQVYRIDHFLGKEATQNIHVLRFGNQLFGDIWNARHVAQIHIDVPETLDVADRAEFYDATGAFRDMIVTHLFQVAAEIAMEPPLDMTADNLQEARESVLSAFRPLGTDDVVFGQVNGYRNLPEVANDSNTDTYAAVRLWVDTDRWRGVPFLLRSGKQLQRSHQRVSLILKKPDGPLRHIPGDGTIITFDLSGPGAIHLDLVLKKPGATLELAEQTISLCLDEVPDSDALPPYVSLLHDVTVGDRSLFTSSAGLASAWKVAQAIVANPPAPLPYDAGSWGPAAGTELAGHSGWLCD